MPDIGSLKQAIDAIFAEHESRCLWFSGGSDSRLLLEVMLETGKPFGILTFPDGWSREQERQVDAVIREKKLQVFSYPPTGTALAGEGDELTFASQYPIDGFGSTVMLFRDIVDGKRCAFDVKFPTARRTATPAEWSVHIWGLRRSDRHWLSGETPMIDETERMVGDKKFLFPLADWSKAEVTATLKKEYGIDLSGEIELGDIACCTACLKSNEPVFCPKEGKEIAAYEWDRAANTQQVRAFLQG